MGWSKAVCEETKISLARSKKRRVECFVASHQSAFRIGGFCVEQNTFEREIDNLQYRLEGASIREKKALAD